MLKDGTSYPRDHGGEPWGISKRLVGAMDGDVGSNFTLGSHGLGLFPLLPPPSDGDSGLIADHQDFESSGRSVMGKRTAGSAFTSFGPTVTGHPRRQRSGDFDPEETLLTQETWENGASRDLKGLDLLIVDSRNNMGPPLRPEAVKLRTSQSSSLGELIVDQQMAKGNQLFRGPREHGEGLGSEVPEEIQVDDESPPEVSEKEVISGSSLGLSPLRKLIRSPWEWVRSPWRSQGRMQAAATSARSTEGLSHKDKNRRALDIARNLRKIGLEKFPIEKDFSAASSRESKVSKRETIKKLAKEWSGRECSLPMTTKCLKAVASVLKLAGYKAGSSYLTEAKLWHLEEGFEWSSVLDRTLTLCKKALDRGRGPRKKAPEVPEAAWCRRSLGPILKAQSMVKFAKETFFFAMVWLLREIELARFTTSDVFFNYQAKQVTLVWKESKMDQEMEGCSRVLQCNCDSACENLCPFHVSQDLILKVEKLNGSGSPLCLDKSLQSASKYLVIQAWGTVFGMKVTGHSARRTGALRYVRSGWAISQVAYLGRWKSNVVYSYAEEALAELAVNGSKRSSQWDEGLQNQSEEKVESWGEVLKAEINQFKKGITKDLKETKDNMVFWKDLYTKNVGTLPSRVLSITSKVIHVTTPASTWSPPITWRTTCGWRFYGSNFCFVEGEENPTCAKCQHQGAVVQGGQK